MSREGNKKTPIGRNIRSSDIPPKLEQKTKYVYEQVMRNTHRGDIWVINDFLRGIWGIDEVKYSGIIAQTIGLSKKFTDFLFDKIGLKNYGAIINISTEAPLKNYGRIDILIECDNDIAIGIENKKWAGLTTENQLVNYYDALKENYKKFYLVFLSLSTYKLQDSQKPQKLSEITYKEILDWLKTSKFEDEFEKNYTEYLKQYIEELEMKPITTEEIKSLMHYCIALTKLDHILSELKQKEESVENSTSRYKLFLRKYKDFNFYIGFWLGTSWYFSDPLIDENIECIIYLKDIGEKPLDSEINGKIQNNIEILKREINDTALVSYHPKKGINEVRLSIRKSLLPFSEREISEIIKWFTDNYAILINFFDNNVLSVRTSPNTVQTANAQT